MHRRDTAVIRTAAPATPGQSVGPATPASPGATVAAASRRSTRWSTYGPVVLGTTGVVGFLALWQLFSLFGPADQKYLPPPTVVLPTFVQNFAYVSFWQALGHTLWAWLLGVVASTTGALVVGVVIGSNSFVRNATHSTIEFLRPIPAVALIPLAALLFGPRLGSELLVVVYACFWIVLIQVLYGIADQDKVALDTVRTFGMTFWQRVRHLTFPTMLPYLVTGLRLAATVALILSISVELIIGTPGLGHEVAAAQINDSPPAMYALILTSGLLGIVINAIFRFAERRVLFWHESVRAEVHA